MQIDTERLARFFTELCQIESPSRKEGGVAQYLREQCGKLGATSIITDDSASATGSETGNLIVSFKGDENLNTALFFAAHMDTVGPTEGLEVVRNDDMFTSGGDTILGADDKSGIAPLLELMSLLKENNIPHCPIELVFTTCEEIGLLGAKALDTSLLRAPYGYALDSTKKGKIVTGAPAANRIKITVQGKAAHSGSAPEAGINALAITAQALAQITLGRIDTLSTANFGRISGGSATNIVPAQIVLEGEVRSHSAEKLARHTRDIETIFHRVVANWPHTGDGKFPSVIIEVREDFPVLSLKDDEPVLLRLQSGARAINRPLFFDIAGGGSDANIFCNSGLPTAIIPTGMANVHTTDEEVALSDMVKVTELLYAMVTDSHS
jgi:tripeptide aminopeptidase